MIGRLLSYVISYRLNIIFIICGMIVMSGLSMIMPYIIGNIFFDRILISSVILPRKVVQCILLMLTIKLLKVSMDVLIGRMNAQFSAKLTYDFRMEIFKALQKHSFSYYNNVSTGDLINNVNNDIRKLQVFLQDQFPFIFINIITIIGSLTIMCVLQWRLTLFIVLPIPIAIWVIVKLQPKMNTLYTKRFKKISNINTLINNYLKGIRVVKAFGKEQQEVEKFNKVSQELYSINNNQISIVEIIYPIIQLLMNIGNFFVVGYGGYLVAKNMMTVGTLITFISYTGMLLNPIQSMIRIVQTLFECINAASRVFEVIDADSEIKDSLAAISMPNMKGDISFKNVSYRYDVSKWVLTNINLEVKSQEVIGIVGHSGAGKSTLAHLITRLYDVQEGAIEIDGISIKDIKLCDLHSQIGVVLQENFLFMGTIADNIAYAKENAGLEEIIDAAKIANAHDFIMRLPDAYETRIGTGGYRLSGGEKQRISIARTILLNPKIIILDEATASLDVVNEKLIQESFEYLMKGRTTFIIAHRLSTLKSVDRIVVIEKGRIKEIGQHEELIKKKGIYYKFFIKQDKEVKNI